MTAADRTDLLRRVRVTMAYFDAVDAKPLLALADECERLVAANATLSAALRAAQVGLHDECPSTQCSLLCADAARVLLDAVDDRAAPDAVRLAQRALAMHAHRSMIAVGYDVHIVREALDALRAAFGDAP